MPIGFAEPKAAAELLEWQEKRRSIAGQKDNVHHLYRTAAGIEDHLHRVNVPPIQIIGMEEALRLKAQEIEQPGEKHGATKEEGSAS